MSCVKLKLQIISDIIIYIINQFIHCTVLCINCKIVNIAF